MKLAKVKTLMALVAALFVLGCSQADFTDADGNEIHWNDFKGRWLVINYWAEWCGPCIEEIPELNRLHEKHKGYNASVLGINFDRPEIVELKRQIETLGVEFPVLHTDPEGKLEHLLPSGLPTTYIFNHSGELKHTLVGPQTQASIEELLQEDG